MTIGLNILFVLLFSATLPLFADNPKTVKSGPYQTAVLELYTSEGCSSCPPADKWLGELTRIPRGELNVLPLAFHVDYWDYIGWKDEFADPAFTSRQRDLGRLNRQRSIYTPEFFVDGREARGVSDVVEKIRQANQKKSPLELELTIHLVQMEYQLHLKTNSDSNKDLKVQFFVYEDGLSNQVKRGENAGKMLNHQRVVRYLSPLIDLQSAAQHTIDISTQWQKPKLGVGAIVKNANDEYIQSVYTAALPL